MPLFADVIRSNAFGVTELTDAVNKMPYEPTFLGDSGLFQGVGISTTTFFIERNHGHLNLVPDQPRNAPGVPIRRDDRDIVPFRCPHLYQEDTVSAAEVQDLKARGMNVGLEDVETMITSYQDIMRRNDDWTQEYHRVGAFLGTILDAGGGTLVDLFDKFGISQEASIDFDLAAATTAEFDADLNGLRRTMQSNLAMGQVQVGQILALCGDTFFDLLIGRTDVRDAYERWQNTISTMMAQPGSFGQPGDFLRMHWVYSSFPYKGVMWHNYQGTHPVSGDPVIPTGEAHFAPNVPGIFHARFGPQNKISLVNDVGLPRYSSRYVDPRDRYVTVDYESNVAYYCSRPEVLMVGTAT